MTVKIGSYAADKLVMVHNPIVLDPIALQPSCFFSAAPAEFRTRILLVEDNDEHARWIHRLISVKPFGDFELLRVPTITEAVSVLGGAEPDLVLLDLGLPDLSGYQCLLMVRLVAPEVPTIVLTGDDSRLTRELASLAGSTKFLVKSDASPEILNQLITDALGLTAA